jgi:hypothetical protein
MANTTNDRSDRRWNTAAVLAVSASALLAFSAFDPVPAGEDPVRTVLVSDVPGETVSDVPVPVDAGSAVPRRLDVQVAGSLGPVTTLSQEESLKFALLLLEDGARFLRNQDQYTVTFHKRERIGGDLRQQEDIDMKVRHLPVFSVYMKWKTGQVGQQVVYNVEASPDRMWVKFGGARGLLPALKIDPSGDVAMRETRHPVTQAGILAMAERIIAHRREELEGKVPVVCVRAADGVVDERPCYCFEFRYQSRDTSPVYRSSRIMIDTRYHIPLRAVNHTWGSDEQVSAEIPAEDTLIEEYMFSRFNFGVQLASEEFAPKFNRSRN